MSKRTGPELRSTRNKIPKLVINDNGSNPPQTPRTSATLLVAIDLGTDFTKGAVMVSRPGKSRDKSTATNPTDTIRGRLQTITWTNSAEYVKTQISFTKDSTSDNHIFRWGSGVDKAIHDGEIEVRDVIRAFKPALFGQDMDRNTIAKEKISKLNLPVRDRILSQKFQQCGLKEDGTQFTDIDFFVMFLQRAWWYILCAVAEDHTHLGIPVHITDQEQYEDWELPKTLKVQVAFPLPAASTPTQVARIIAAAEAAGIPNPYPVAEPLSILTYQLRTEEEECTIGKPIIVIDIGAGSADIQAWQVLSTKPLRVRQIGSSQTHWVGGRILNEKCMNLIQHEIPEVRPVLSLSQGDNRASPAYDKFVYNMEEEFNERKREFDGNNTVVLSATGLPGNIKMLNKGGNIALTVEQLTALWDPSIQAICTSVSTATHEIGHVDHVLLCGGSSMSKHLRNEVRETLHPLEVRTPLEQAGGSRTVAMGAVYLLLDKEFITSRTVLHGFCVAWLKPVSQLAKQQFPAYCVETSAVDGIDRVNVSKFFFHAGDSVPTQYKAPSIRGFRQLRLRALEHTATAYGWEIVETLYYCTHRSADDLAVEDPANGIIAMPIPLTYTIPYQTACDLWEVHEEGAEDFYVTDYEVVLFMDGERLRFEVVLPEGGEFDAGRDSAADVHLDVSFNVVGAFDLVNRG